jgi:hypothetical protein
LFALLLAGRHTFLAWLLLLFIELFCEFLDLLTLTRVVAHRVVHRALGAIVVAARRFRGALVTSWATAPPTITAAAVGCCHRPFLLVVLSFVVISALSGGPCIGLAILPFHRGRWGVSGTALCGPSTLVRQAESSMISYMSCVTSFSSIFSSLTPWRNATTTEALEIRGMVL